MRAEFLTTFPSAQVRAGHPDQTEPPHPRAIEMSERMAETAASFGNVTATDLISAGFTSQEIIEHEPAARAILKSGFVRQVAPQGDRVPDFLAKAIAAAAHRMPLCASMHETVAMREAWDRFCRSRAAFKLDPWTSQSERCLTLLDGFMKQQPLLGSERNRVLVGLAASQKLEARATRQ